MVRPITDTSAPKPEDPTHMERKHNNVWQGWNRAFSPHQLKKCPELIPVTIIMFFSPILSLFAIRHLIKSNPTYRASNKRDQESAMSDWVRPNQSTKVYKSNPGMYAPIPELEEAKKHMKEAAPKK